MVAGFAQLRGLAIMDVVREAFDAYGLSRKYAKLLEERLANVKKTSK